MTNLWEKVERPGYFGRKRDKIVDALDTKYGEQNKQWTIYWHYKDLKFSFLDACKFAYEESYVQYLENNPTDVDYICSFGECIDNDISNIKSGLDYTAQESWATHIQDIAVRNAIHKLGRSFEGPKDKILVIRTKDDSGFKFGPGNIPFFDPSMIEQPSMRPKWANEGSVEDYWQSNKWIYCRSII